MDITTLISLAEKKLDLGGSTPTIEEADRQILRRLAGRVAEFADRPAENEKRALWSRHNALERTSFRFLNASV